MGRARSLVTLIRTHLLSSRYVALILRTIFYAITYSNMSILWRYSRRVIVTHGSIRGHQVPSLPLYVNSILACIATKFPAAGRPTTSKPIVYWDPQGVHYE
jgi:hypothetical protein